MTSNRETVIKTISKYPGLRFHELKKETKLANGTLQHHLSSLSSGDKISVVYMHKIPRYFNKKMESSSTIIINRLRQNTTSKIIKSLLKNDCMAFGQIVE